MSGHVTGTYDGRSRSLTFGESQLTLLHSQLCLSGRVGDNVHVEVQSSDTSELQPIFKVFQPGIVVRLFDVTNAQIAFTGEVRGGGSAVSIGGDLGLRNFEAIHRHWDSLQSNVSASNEAIAFRNLRLQQGPVEIIGNVSTGLSDWTINRDSPLSAQVRISGQRIAGLLSQLFFGQIDVTGGDGTAAVNLRGTTERLSGSGQVSLAHVRVFNQPVDALRIPVRLQDGTLQIEAGHVRTGGANATFSFNYQPMNQSFHSGDLSISLDTNQFALSSLGEIAQRLPDVRARAELHGQAHVAVSPGGVKLLAASGTATLRRIEFPGVHGGELSLDIASREGFAVAGVAGNLEGTRVGGNARVALNEGNYTTGALQFGAVQLGPLIGMLYPSLPQRLNGVAAGEVTFAGPLQSPALGKASVRLSELEIVIPKQGDTVIRSLEPVAVEIEHGTANIRRMRMGTTGTELHLSGAVGLEGRHAVDIRADGGLNLQSLETFDENIRCTGSAHVTASISGTLERPSLAGDMQLRDASAFFKNIGMGFTDAAGTVRFNRNHAVLERLTAQSGGGNLFVSGSILFGGGTPLSYNLSATASNIRTRYLGASITGNAALRLAGTSVNGVLAGNVQLSRVVFDPQADATALLASAIASPPAALNQQDFTAGIALDVEVQSTPDLEIVSTLSTNLQARVDLRLRGTRARPVLSGHISTQEGDLKIFGAKYTINRGEITFSNTARIEPVLDLDLQTETRGITVDIVVTGTPSKLNMNYRSDPPLQPKDIIALLTVGQAPAFGNVTNGTQIGPDVSALQAGASSVLSGALSPRSGGLTRLFGVTNIKIDPLVQGLTNTPQARLTLEQQVSKNVSVIYVTNLAQT
ncbi:MAG: translocation/assembly module TamB domain-containing protein, partial [Acidobacteriaceae bacterium]|nr:translocation/assembly module TamB domain-containing protein [Acidobacteriaceae bacterium]